MYALFITLDAILGFYWWIIIIAAIMSWLFAFNVINANNQAVRQIYNLLYQLTEPVLGPIRRVVPMIGQLDISPLVLLFAIMFLRIFLRTSVAPAMGIVY